MVANTGMFTSKDQVTAYIAANAGRYGLDPAALLAVANGEGLNTTPGSTWVVPGEAYPSFGPPSWYGGGAGGPIISAQGSASAASRWAWSPAGLDYWMQSAANAGAAGQTGATAIATLVTNFERPASQYVSGNIADAIRAYDSFSTRIRELIVSGQLPTIIPNDPEGQGNAIVPVPGNANGQGTLNPVSPPTGSTADLRLGKIGPFDIGVPQGLMLGLWGVTFLLIGALLFAFGGNIRASVNTVGMRYSL